LKTVTLHYHLQHGYRSR